MNIDDINEDLEDIEYIDYEIDENCPKCGREYDEIDYEFQICHICGYINE